MVTEDCVVSREGPPSESDPEVSRYKSFYFLVLDLSTQSCECVGSMTTNITFSPCRILHVFYTELLSTMNVSCIKKNCSGNAALLYTAHIAVFEYMCRLAEIQGIQNPGNSRGVQTGIDEFEQNFRLR